MRKRMLSIKKVLCVSVVTTMVLLPMTSLATEVENSIEEVILDEVVEEVVEEATEEVVEEITEEVVEEITEEVVEETTEETSDEVIEQMPEEVIDTQDSEQEEQAMVIDTSTVETVFYCETECKLNHNHQTEICEIGYYGTMLDWTNIPYVWEFRDEPNNDNDACWGWGKSSGNYIYTTPQGEFDNDVKNKIAIHSDGEYVYVNMIQATVNYGARVAATDLQFTVDGVLTEFQLMTASGNTLEAISEPGTYEVYLKHAGEKSLVSGELVEGGEAKVYINGTQNNTEIEFKFPVEAFKVQYPEVDLDNINEIKFFTSNLMWNPMILAGISTFPLLLAGLCLLAVGAGVFVTAKKKRTLGA